MKSTSKQRNPVPSGQLVKHNNNKRVVLAILLALTGLIVYTISYQYTHQAKLEADLKAKQSQVQSQLKQLNTTKSLNAEQQKKIDDLNKQNQDLQKQLQAKAAARTVYAQAPVGVKDCGGDPYKSFIYSHESGCNTASINRGSGACGLGQALPCSKMPCSLSDWACQDAFFTKYALGRYGSWQAAYGFWLKNHWW